jgi:hypothetical protein
MKMDGEVPCQFIRDYLGARYDYAGLMLSQVLAFGRHNPDKWFCSEICAAALGLPNPQRVSPQFLFDVINWHSKTDLGQARKISPKETILPCLNKGNSDL